MHLSTFLKSKIHRATVTDTQLDYEGSVAIDPDLMAEAKIKIWEQIDIYNETNGHRWTTYVIEGVRGSREISVRGPGARLCMPGDIVHMCTYLTTRFKCPKPTQIKVDENNEVI